MMMNYFPCLKPKRIKKITMLPVKRGRGRPPKFSSAPNSPSPSSPIPNGYAENGRHKKFKYKRVITGDSPVDEVINLFTVPFNNMQNLKFRSSLTVAFSLPSIM